MRFCNRCGCKVDKETELDYTWVCPNCNENLSNVETDTVSKLNIAWILYGLYLHDWIATHDEGEPVCFSEFLDNEYIDDDWMVGLLVKYSLEQMIDEYHSGIQCFERYRVSRRKMSEMAKCPYCNVDLDSVALFKEIIEINSDSDGMLWLEYLCACPECDKMFRGFEEYEYVGESTMRMEESE